MHEGMPYSQVTGLRIATMGPGRAKCSCGVYSVVLQSNNARKRWHKEHKRIVALEAESVGAQPSVESVETETGEWMIAESIDREHARNAASHSESSERGSRNTESSESSAQREGQNVAPSKSETPPTDSVPLDS